MANTPRRRVELSVDTETIETTAPYLLNEAAKELNVSTRILCLVLRREELICTKNRPTEKGELSGNVTTETRRINSTFGKTQSLKGTVITPKGMEHTQQLIDQYHTDEAQRKRKAYNRQKENKKNSAPNWKLAMFGKPQAKTTC